MSNQNPNRSISPRSGGFFQDVANRFRLIGRLIMDDRINPLIKLLPIGTLIYVITPVDLLPINPVDDAFIVWLGTTLFVDLCPPEVVQEHTLSLKGIVASTWNDYPKKNQQDDIVEGEYSETDSKTNR